MPIEPTQDNPPGKNTSEYNLSWLASVGPFALAALALLALILGKLDFQQLLTALGLVLGPSAVSGLVASNYATNRTNLKRDMTKGTADVAVAQAEASSPKPKPAGFTGDGGAVLVGVETEPADRVRGAVGFRR